MIWEFFIRNNRFAYLFLVALIGIGSYSVLVIPKESSPEVVIPVGIVTTVLPGAPAADVESLVTNEIERGLSSLENVSQITSVSRKGISSVTVEFEAEADLDASITDLKDEVDTITPELPDNAEDPTVSEVSFVDQPIMTIAVAANLTDAALTSLASDVEDQLEAVTGVSRVNVQGARDREVTVIVDQTALERFNLSVVDVTRAIGNANRTVPVGQIENDGVVYNITFEGDIPDTSAVANVPITARGGQPILVRDVATIDDGLAPAATLSRLSVEGEPSENSVSFNIYKQSGGDITAIAAAVRDRLAELTEPEELLANATAVTILDAGEQIEKELLRLTTSGLQTVTLVILLLVFAIGWREALLAGLAIPLSFLFGFIGLYLSGNTINFLSLFSLILGIGILVDSAIVMVEGINHKMKADPTIDKRWAAVQTIREFSTPLITGTLTTVSMFVGLFIVSGVTGQFIASIPFTLIFLLFASLFVALAIIPLIATTFLHRHDRGKLAGSQTAYAHRLEHWYRTKLAHALSNRDFQNKFLSAIFAALVFALFLPINLIAGVIAGPLVYAVTRWTYVLQERRAWGEGKRKLAWLPLVVVSIVVATFVANSFLPTYNPVKVIFFDQSDTDYVIIEVETPVATTKEVTDLAVRQVSEKLYDEPDIDSFTVTVGSGSQFGSGNSGERYANIFINLETDRERTSSEIVAHLRNETATFNDFEVTVTQPSDGPPTGAAIIIKFLGDDLDEITNLANQATDILRTIPGSINVARSTDNNSTEYVLALDLEKTAAVGLDPFTVSQVARTALFGTEATSLTTLTEDIPVQVKLNVSQDPTVTADATDVTSINALTDITLTTPTGSVPLSSLVNVSLRESSAVIRHEDSTRVVQVTADAATGVNARELQATALEQIKSNLTIPDSVSISTGGGETDESNQAFIEMFFALIVGVTLMVGILTLQFNSYLHMRYVLSILPYSLIGILVGLALTQNSLSFPSLMGFIALSGIVVNNSILLIDMMNRMRRENSEKSLETVVLDTASNRLRPILLTTITTVIGMIPLTYAGDIWAPLAYAVMFGLVFSALVTLLLIPILYFRRPGAVGR